MTSLDRLDGLLAARRPRNGSYLTIAVDGRGGSGKTSFAELLTEREGFTVIHGDDYFAAHDDPVTWGDWDEERLEADVLSKARVGERRLHVRRFDFVADGWTRPSSINVDRVLVVERCFAMALDAPWDLTVWVETRPDVCLARGLARAHGLGERAQLAWETVWQPAEQRHIDDHAPAQTADLVLDGTRPFPEQLQA